jgi:hypothetical protein
VPLVSRAAERHDSGKDGSGDKDLLPRHNTLRTRRFRGHRGPDASPRRAPAIARAEHSVAGIGEGVECPGALIGGVGKEV